MLQYWYSFIIMHLGDVMKNIQTNLLSAFESSGLTYDELARRTNLPKSALYRYINGDTEKIPIDRFQSICYELKVDASSLLGWKDQPLTQEARNDIGLIYPDEADIIKAYRSLPAPGKQYVQQQLVAARLMYGEKPADSAAADK